MMVVLGLGQLLGEFRAMVIVHHGESRHDRLVAADLLGDERIADEIAQSFGTIAITTFGDQFVKVLQQFLFDGNPGSDQFCHFRFSRSLS